jgi:hypothetical protein
MTTTVRVTYSAEGSPNTVMTFDLTGINIEAIKKELPLKKKELPLKKKELDTKFDVDPRKSSIKMDDISIRDPMIF